ncbi:MAG: deoxyguanosinetriphosphate triphosphohydrolase [Eubacteriales bacterium]|nr:deoxyguanosinetriphosphate triphosphohydrolase [Eubacteriales bacterium]
MQDGEIRIMREKLEQATLSERAMLVVNSRGRAEPLPLCPLRTEYIRDRDRILHCKSFRRLKHKTQVFLAPQGDHYRTRLTHTLEVAQIARTIARSLRLNEDLTEAIALGHDLGHTPFGHAGESVLDRLVPTRFEHNKQSLRVVDKLEYDGKGLNLTFEVRDGIVNHKKDGTAATNEGRVVSLSDRIAYINHDIDDAIRAGVLKESDLPKSCTDAFGNSHGRRINTMIISVVEWSLCHDEIGFAPELREEFDNFRTFMFENVYHNPIAKSEEKKAMRVVEELFQYYMNNVDAMPWEFKQFVDEDGKERVVADFIACMTDNYAITDYKRLFVPISWG